MKDYFYKMDEQGCPVSCSAEEFCRTYNSGGRTIGKTEVGEATVSTVFLGIPHVSNRLDQEGKDFLFETMVFAPDSVMDLLKESRANQFPSIAGLCLGVFEVQRRYRTVEEARQGHEEMVNLVREILAEVN